VKFKGISVVVASLVGLLACSPLVSSDAKIFSAVRDQLKEKVVVRFEWGELDSGELLAVLSAVNARNGTNLTEDMFVLTEERELFSSLYRRYALTIADVPVEKSSIRVWLDPQNKKPLQIEVRLQAMPDNVSFVTASQNVVQTSDAVRRIIAERNPGESPQIMSTSNYWSNGTLVQRVEVLGKRGRYQFDFANGTSQLLSHRFRPFNRADLSGHKPLTAPLYRIWEWANNGNTLVLPEELQSRELLPIKNLISEIPAVDHSLIARAS
jgi:hypothetical protein